MVFVRGVSEPQVTRLPLRRTADEQAEEDAFQALYGTWSPLSPSDIAAELAGFDRPWWVVGGWAIEAATGYRREHDDTDISILSRDVPAFVTSMSARWHVWNNVGGVQHPLGDRWPTVDDPTSQLWVRRNATSPWVMDVPLTPDRDGLWTNRRLPNHVLPVTEATCVAADGIRYLSPEIVLLYKAALHRPKDDLDFEATLPTLSKGRRRWMREALSEVAPEHAWLDRL